MTKSLAARAGAGLLALFMVVAGVASPAAAADPRALIEATVVDAETGAPLSNVCLFAATRTHFRFPDGCWPPSDSDGKITIRVPRGDTYQLLAWPAAGSGYGAQWVGTRGGTGDQRRAARVTVADAGHAVAPTVRMDAAGAITGTVTDPTGAPLAWGRVLLANEVEGLGGWLGFATINGDGQYTFGELGPYEWPLGFSAFGHAQQWSGVTVDRYRADRVPVVAGGSVNYDYQLVNGTAVTLTDVPAGTFGVMVLNARTGDRAGSVMINPLTGSGTIQLMGPQVVKLQIRPQSGPVYFLGGSDFESATSFVIGDQEEQTISLGS